MDDLGVPLHAERKHALIPIYVVEDHHNVVPHIHANIRRKFLPAQGITFIHFDSHPDMLIPKDMPANHALDAHLLYEAHDIENWIMPNCYSGIFDRLIWVKPPWANQMSTRHQKVFIGECKDTHTIRVECRENYFVAEGLYQPRQNMLNVKEFTLECLTVGTEVVQGGDNLKDIRAVTENTSKAPTILDIDLDFFSTQNPFRAIFPEADTYNRLKGIFKFEPPESSSETDILKAQKARLRQLDEIKGFFENVEKFGKMPDFEEAQPNQIYTEISCLVDALLQSYSSSDLDWELIFNAGCTIDDHELPHHVSTEDELYDMFECFQIFVNTMSEPPRIITISRSAGDDYTPHSQVELIQKIVVDILSKKFKCDKPELDYEVDNDSVSSECSGVSELDDVVENSEDSKEVSG